jgi:hypothetical protein
LVREFRELRMGPGVVPNFVPFRQSPSRNFGMRNDVGTYHEEGYFDVGLLQNVKQSGGPGYFVWFGAKPQLQIRTFWT